MSQQKDMGTDFTVAIPTYNGATRLPEVLERLQAQIGTAHINWEILVVDNNSTDSTAQVVRTYQADWTQVYPLRYCWEPKPGAALARQRAIQEARAFLIGFLDDDNLPASNWVAAACAFAEAHPKAGAYGSQIHGVYEVNPPPNFERIKAFLAVTERGSEALLYHPQRKLLPPSAGLVVRKEAWLGSIPARCILRGRTTESMLTSEDLEALAYIQQNGWEIWYNPQMEVEHKIPKYRLTSNYLIPFMGGIGLSRYVTRMVGVRGWFKPILILAYFSNDLRKFLIHVLKYRKTVKTDVVAACERALLTKSLMSPFYFWNKGIW